MLRAQHERGRDNPWMPDDLRIDLTEVPLVRPGAPDGRKFMVSGRHIDTEYDIISRNDNYIKIPPYWKPKYEDSERILPAEKKRVEKIIRNILKENGDSDKGSTPHSGKISADSIKKIFDEFKPEEYSEFPIEDLVEAIKKLGIEIEFGGEWVDDVCLAYEKNGKGIAYSIRNMTNDADHDYVSREISETIAHELTHGISSYIFNSAFPTSEDKPFTKTKLPEELLEPAKRFKNKYDEYKKRLQKFDNRIVNISEALSYILTDGEIAEYVGKNFPDLAESARDAFCNFVEFANKGTLSSAIKDTNRNTFRIYPFDSMASRYIVGDSTSVIGRDYVYGTHYNVVGMKGLERFVGTKENDKLVKELQKVYDTTYNHLLTEHKEAHDYRGGMRKPRMWEVEKKMQDGSVKLSVKLNGKTLRVHFTGAGTDKKPRLEYQGDAADIKAETLELLKDKNQKLRVSDVFKDDIFEVMYPDLANASILVAERGDYSGQGVKTAAKVTGDVGDRDNQTMMKVVNMPVRQEVRTDRGRSRKLTCVAMPGVLNFEKTKKSKDAIIVYADSLDEKNLEKLNKDMSMAIVDLIAADEGWRDPKLFSLKNWKKYGKSRRNSDGTYNEGATKDITDITREGDSTGTVDGSQFSTMKFLPRKTRKRLPAARK